MLSPLPKTPVRPNLTQKASSSTLTNKHPHAVKDTGMESVSSPAKTPARPNLRQRPAKRADNVF